MHYLAWASNNKLPLVLLDGVLQELPADVPHMRVQVSSERQVLLTLSPKAHNDRTVEVQ
jgi:hypothetical protein